MVDEASSRRLLPLDANPVGLSCRRTIDVDSPRHRIFWAAIVPHRGGQAGGLRFSFNCRFSTIVGPHAGDSMESYQESVVPFAWITQLNSTND